MRASEEVYNLRPPKTPIKPPRSRAVVISPMTPAPSLLNQFELQKKQGQKSLPIDIVAALPAA
jgi:hypothetical protein